MENRRGKCKNFGNCTKADHGEIIELSFTEDFVCPECNDELIEETIPSKPPIKKILIGVLTFIILCGIGVGVYFLFFNNGKDTPPGQGGITTGNPTVQTADTVQTVDTVKQQAAPAPPKVLVESISLNQSKLSLKVNQSETLTATVLPDSAANQSLEWSSSDASIATVDENGKITAVAKTGKAKITAKAMDDSQVSASCDISVIDGGTTTGKKDLGYAVYTGDMKNGKANGTGRLVFKTSHAISAADPQNRMAEPGDYLDGQFENNTFYSGKWFGRDGAQKGAIILQKSGIPSY